MNVYLCTAHITWLLSHDGGLQFLLSEIKRQLVNSSCHCPATCWMHVMVLFFEPMKKPWGMRDNSLKWEKNKIKIITQQITLHKGWFSFLWRSALSDFPVFFFTFLLLWNIFSCFVDVVLRMKQKRHSVLSNWIQRNSVTQLWIQQTPCRQAWYNLVPDELTH